MLVQSRLVSDLTFKMTEKERREFERELDKKLAPHLGPWSAAVAEVKTWRRKGGKGDVPGGGFPDAPAATDNETVDAVLADEHKKIKANYDGWVAGTLT